MKLLHTADWHLGKVIFSRSLLEEQEQFLYETFLPAVDREDPDLILISGDVFDRPIAPVEAIRLFDDLLYALCAERRRKVAIISGNHDSADRLTVGAEILKKQGLYIASRIKAEPEPVRLCDEFGPIELWMLPYFDPAQVREVYKDETIRGFQEAYERALAAVRERQTPGARQVLMAHCFVTGSKKSESESPLSIGGSGEVDGALFSGFDYVALGHLHGPQPAGKNARYAGSPLKYSFDEAHHKKSLTVVELGEKTVAVRQLPITPKRDMRMVEGTLEELLRAAKTDERREDFLYATLLDEAPVFEPMARLREGYPNLLGLECVWLRGGSDQSSGRDALRKSLRAKRVDDRAVFEAFLRQVCDREPDEELTRLFCELAGEEERL